MPESTAVMLHKTCAPISTLSVLHPGKTGNFSIAAHAVQVRTELGPGQNVPADDDDQKQDDDRDRNRPDRSISKVFKGLRNATGIVGEGGIYHALNDQARSQCGNKRIYLELGDDQPVGQPDRNAYYENS